MGKLNILLKMFSVYSNPLLAFFDRMALVKGTNARRLSLKNGLEFTVRPNTSDISIVNEVFLYLAYDSVFDNAPVSSDKKPVIVDIGANIGIFSVYAARRFPEARIISLEPMSDNFELIKENLRLNNMTSQVTPVKKGIGGSSGKAVLYRNDDTDTGGGSLYMVDKDAFKGVTTEIELTTLEDIFKEWKIEKIDIMKVDCEGGEYEFFYSTPRDILEKISSMIIECHTHTVKDWRAEKARLVEFLKASGFEVADIPSFALLRAWRNK